MTKSEIITLVAAEADGSQILADIAAILNGNEKAEDDRLYTLSELSAEINYNSTWLNKLRVHKMCGVQIAGRRRYGKHEVMEYLKSQTCRDRVAELRNKRKYKNER